MMRFALSVVFCALGGSAHAGQVPQLDYIAFCRGEDTRISERLNLCLTAEIAALDGLEGGTAEFLFPRLEICSGDAFGQVTSYVALATCLRAPVISPRWPDLE